MRTLGLRELPGATAARGRCFEAGTSGRAGTWGTWFAFVDVSEFSGRFLLPQRLVVRSQVRVPCWQWGGGGRCSQLLGGGWPGHWALCGPVVWVFGLGCSPIGRVECSAGVINILVFMKETRVCVCVHMRTGLYY